PLLAVLGIALFIQFQDANRFKPTIEQQAIEQAGINLSIDGSLTWSLYPLGIDINDMQISDQHGQAFASIKRILAQVDLFSLLKGSPSVHTLLLDSAKISLFEDEQGKANWLNILPTQETAALEKDTSETKAKDSNQDSKNQKTSELSFLLSQLSISNLNIAYTSELKNQSIKLSPASIKVSNIAPNKDVPFDIDFTFEDTIEKLTLNSNIIGLIEKQGVNAG
ncbi:AsmA family protein, partial [Oleiphilus sp. HI0061]|uniref:AsmA family protein n=1 Tax=Oleiphilus sp. HI0061 TaxID=1822239 RepID=UPI000B0E1CB9